MNCCVRALLPAKAHMIEAGLSCSGASRTADSVDAEESFDYHRDRGAGGKKFKSASPAVIRASSPRLQTPAVITVRIGLTAAILCALSAACKVRVRWPQRSGTGQDAAGAFIRNKRQYVQVCLRSYRILHSRPHSGGDTSRMRRQRKTRRRLAQIRPSPRIQRCECTM